MAAKRRHWIRDILIVPLVVGVIVTTAQFVLPLLAEKKTELSYEIYSPIKFIDRKAIGDIDLTVYVDGVETGLIEISRVHVWNSGDVPLKKVPISYVFTPQREYVDSFQVLNVAHETQPTHEFGDIVERPSTRTKKSFEYHLLNERDEFTATFIANAPGSLAVYAKLEGMKVKRVTAGPARPFPGKFTAIAMGLALLTLVVVVFLEVSFPLLRRLLR